MTTEQVAEVTAKPSTEGLPPVTATEEAATPPAEDAEAVTASTEAAKEAKPQPAWATIDDPYEVLDHPDIKTIRERDDSRKDEQRRAEFEREFDQKHRDWEATNLHRTVQSAFGRVLEKLADVDAPGFEKAIDRVESLVQPYLDDARKQAVDEGRFSAAKGFTQLFYHGLDRRASDELDILTKRESTTWQDLFEFREKARIEKAVAPVQKKLDDQEAENERLKVELREIRGGPPPGGSGGGGGGINSMADADEAYANHKIDTPTYKGYRKQFGVDT